MTVRPLYAEARGNLASTCVFPDAVLTNITANSGFDVPNLRAGSRPSKVTQWKKRPTRSCRRYRTAPSGY